MPLSLVRKSHIALTETARNMDKELLNGLERRGFKLDFGEDGTGWQFKYTAAAATTSMSAVRI
jgi:putative flavoprotein involved in K+ transport